MKKQKSYAELLSESRQRQDKPDSSLNRYAAPLSARPKHSKGQSHRHTWNEAISREVTIKKIIVDSSKYSPAKYYPCTRCGRHVGLATRRKQPEKRGRHGYTELECSTHLK